MKRQFGRPWKLLLPRERQSEGGQGNKVTSAQCQVLYGQAWSTQVNLVVTGAPSSRVTGILKSPCIEAEAQHPSQATGGESGPCTRFIV